MCEEITVIFLIPSFFRFLGSLLFNTDRNREIQLEQSGHWLVSNELKEFQGHSISLSKRDQDLPEPQANFQEKFLFLSLHAFFATRTGSDTKNSRVPLQEGFMRSVLHCSVLISGNHVHRDDGSS